MVLEKNLKVGKIIEQIWCRGKIVSKSKKKFFQVKKFFLSRKEL